MQLQNEIALSGVAVAALALILTAVIQLILWSDRRLARMPHLRIWLGTEQGGFVSFGIANDGLGAAIIEKFDFQVDSKPVEFQMLFTELCGEGETFVSQRLAPPPAEIGAQSSVELFRIAWARMSDNDLMQEFAKRVGASIQARPLALGDKRVAIHRNPIAP